MMNLSMSHPVPNFGDSFTVTCYVCGMPSSKEWAQKARSRPSTPMKPYYPFLLQVSPTGGAVLREDGSTYLCAFCHASLEAQWNMYESQQVIPPPNRKYNIQKFICAVCGVETYRKRIRALPFQEFPFLEKQRQPGSITLGNNPLAVVCLDCSETLWAQSAEYDRWGLPVHKRHFNWMARPPPPEDSVEATVARLPSGETQLPRCPPTEPVLTRNLEPPTVKILETQISIKARSKGKGESPKLENSHNLSSPTPQGRKTSLTSTTPPTLEIVGNFHNQQPPVVTVAPMSSHTTVISLRKDSMALPSGIIASHQGSAGIYPQATTGVYPPAASYAPYVWGNAPREATQRTIEAYPYGAQTAETIPSGTWPWMAHPTSDLIRYQTYVSSLHNRSRIVEGSASGSPTHTSGSGSYSGGAEPRYQVSPASASSTAVSGVLREHERSVTEEQRQIAAINSERRTGGVASYEEVVYQSKGSPDPKGKRSPKIVVAARDTEKPSTSSSSKPYPSHPKKVKEMDQVSRNNSSVQSVESEKVSAGVSSSGMVVESGGNDEQLTRRECHIPKKRNWHVFMKESQAASAGTTSGGEDPPKTPPSQEMLVPHPKKKKSSLSECLAEGTSLTGKPVTGRGSPGRPTTSRDSAIDLSVPVVDVSGKSSTQALKGAGAKFRIEYLCQSTSTNQQGEKPGQVDDIANRTSVIRCAPKVPPIAENTSHDEKVQSEDEEESEDSESQHFQAAENAGSSLKDEEKEKKVSRKKSSATSGKTEEKVGKNDQAEDKINEDDKKVDGERQPVKDEQQKKEVGKEESKENEGKRERQRKDSTMNTDTDDDDIEKNEDLPNIEQFIKETVLELVSREREREKVQRELGNKQKEFLNELGLITPEKKTDLDIKSIVSRHEKNTLPPLPLRADTKLGRKIGKQLKELLLKVSLQDPTLFEEKPEAEKCDFMAELGMKTAQTSDKTKREIKWRVILMERMRRELRDAAARGVKHEWEKSEILKKFASCDLDSFFNSLSYAALQASEEELEERKLVNKTENGGDAMTGDASGETSEDTANGNGVCINYPKYIPSYAVAGTSTSTVKIEAEDGDGDKTMEVTEDAATAFVEPILKIPVVPPQRRLHSESSSVTTVTSDTDDSEIDRHPFSSSGGDTTAFKFSLGVSSGPHPLRIDSLIQCSNTYWQQMKRSIDEILNDLESSKEDVPLEDKSVHLDKLRKHLKSQLSDIKEIEKRFRATSKAICASRKKSV